MYMKVIYERMLTKRVAKESKSKKPERSDKSKAEMEEEDEEKDQDQVSGYEIEEESGPSERPLIKSPATKMGKPIKHVPPKDGKNKEPSSKNEKEDEGQKEDVRPSRSEQKPSSSRSSKKR